jgi:E-phenylitaconyl-CoA hydratase
MKYHVEDGIAHFLLDNGKMNVLTPQVYKDFFQFLSRFEIDREARAGILYGAGYDEGRSFCAGDDIKNKYRPERTRQQELEAFLFLHQDEAGTPSRPGWEEDVYRHRRYKPIVAAVSGYCLGAGMACMLQHSDIRVADPSAKFGLPEVTFGAAGLSGTTRLARHLAPVDAAWIALTGEFLSAADAERIRLVNEVVPPENLIPRAVEIAKLISRHPSTAVRIEMEALEIGQMMDRYDAARFGQQLYKLHRTNYEGYGSKEGFFAERKKEKDS